MTLTYDVGITDDSGTGSATSTTKQVVVTITGTNDAPTIELAPIVTEVPIPDPLPPGTDALAVHEIAPAMSEDGRWVVFFSAEQIPGGNDNGSPQGDVFLYDRLTGVTKVLTDDAHIPDASRPHDGMPEHYSGFAISGDGSDRRVQGRPHSCRSRFPDQATSQSYLRLRPSLRYGAPADQSGQRQYAVHRQ